jgi:hypothetical protein
LLTQPAYPTPEHFHTKLFPSAPHPDRQTESISDRLLDNLNTHFRQTFVDVLGETAAAALLQRVQFHYTPKHASWLNMAEIEIGIMDRQCTGQRIATAELLRAEVKQWQQQRNAAGGGIEWKFTRQDADRKLCRHYVS